MDHERIEQQNLAELYATGRLSPEDVELFEEHLLECRECRERVAWADDLRESVRTAAREDVVRTTAGLGVFAWLARRGWLVAALLALLLLPAWLLLDRSRLERELAAARRPAPETPALPLPTPPAESAREADLEAERRRLEQELKAALEAHARLAEEVVRLTRPQVNTAIFSIGVVRGDEPNANEIQLGPAPEWIVLSVDPPQAGHDLYRATLVDSHGRVIWKGDGLRPGAGDALVLSVYSTLLERGSYRLRLEALGAGGKVEPAGEVPFRVRR
jgi:hypothetical protein